MSDIDTARAFFEACETGEGWAGCARHCHADAGFACQSGALADVTTLEGYAEWMKGLLTPLPDGRYELHGFAEDPATGVVMAFATFHGTHTGPGGPDPATGKATASHYVYAMAMEGGKVRSMTKIWNDAHALKELGWA